MELKGLMAGIGVVVDDALDEAATDELGTGGDPDLILQIVEWIEQEWDLPFYKANAMPAEKTWSNLLQAASFILLDWKLWPTGASQIEAATVKQIRRFLEHAKDYFVPVFIFTNENIEDIELKLPPTVYRKESAGKNFVFIRRKADLFSGDKLDFGAIEDWIRGTASVYALKTWEQVFQVAKRELFSSMYSKSPDWPKLFWKAYADDGVNPSSSLTHLITDSLRGRMGTGAFEAKILAAPPSQVPKEELRSLIGETSFHARKNLPDDEIRCGDLFRLPKGRFLLNVRPDCDCVPRNGKADDVELYCIEGRRIGDSELSKKYQGGHFDERVWESIAFSVYERKSLRFDFRRLHIEPFSRIRAQRVGRLLHPYLTRIQQRFALYLQRQGLPRIPEGAVL